MKTGFLVVAGLFLIAGLFCIRYSIGEKCFWGKKYITKGFRLLLSRRVDGYILDTIGICFIIIYAIVMFQLTRLDQLALWGTWDWVLEVLVMPLLSLTMFISSYFLRRIFAFYSEQGLFISAPLRHICITPWNEIKEIRLKKDSCFEVLSCQNQVLIRFFLSKKSSLFLNCAELHGVSVKGSKAYKMLYNSSTRQDDALQKWNYAIAHSSYAKNNILSYGEFRDFIVVLFMDKNLNENNVIAINPDGSTRWTISEIITYPKPISYVAMSVEGPETIGVLSVLDRQYHGVISIINVYTAQVIRQINRSEL